MDLDFIMKTAGIAMTVAVTCQILGRVGRDDQGNLVALAGVVAMLVLLFGEIASLFDTVRDIFGL